MSQLKFQDYDSEGSITTFADVILPVPIPKLFTYRIPRALEKEAAIGHRVIVQFGKKKILTGVIGKLHHQPPKEYEARYIFELLDTTPIVNPIQLKLFHWISEYYLCTIGEVLNIALPSGLKLSSESNIQLHPDFEVLNSGDASENDIQEIIFTEKEALLINALKEKKSISYSEAANLLSVKNVHQYLKSLLERNIILIYEEVKEKFQPKKIRKVKLSGSYENKEALEALFEKLSNKPKQEDILLKYLQEVPVFKSSELNKKGLAKSLLLHGNVSSSSLQTLIKNKVFEEFEVIVSRFESDKSFIEKEVTLNEAQFLAKTEIMALFAKKDTVLLHGVTGSGKTEIYIQLIKEALEGGSQVLYLLPEIALTTQIVSRLRKFFGDKMGIYHSKFSDNERVEVWKGVLSGKFTFVVGVRSSIFLPFDNLGLIIVDEEHETSYKQHEPAPRYHARDLALVLSKWHYSKTLLGSATPSIESFYNATNEKYGLVTISQRYGGAVLPEMVLADIRAGRKKKTVKADFTKELIEGIENTLSKGEQAIIFQNRRGYAPYLTCEDCAWIPQCENCSVSLTYHMYHNELRCHYCSYKQKVPGVCSACGSTHIKTIGFGTEKLEDDLKLLFPGAKIQRMDLDTTRRKYSYQTIIDNFEKGNIDILVGTQMVSKGLDFDNVSLVGIVDADRMLYFPDFRSFERAFQMIMQVSGRAGRREKSGNVIIQTANIAQPVLADILQNDYEGMFQKELMERSVFNYPPFVRLIKITIKNEKKEVCEKAALTLQRILAEKLGSKLVLGPQEPVISKIRNLYLMDIMIKLKKNEHIPAIKQLIKQERQAIIINKEFKKSRINIDVDPL